MCLRRGIQSILLCYHDAMSIIFFLLSTVPVNDVVESAYAVQEVNHVYDDEGQHVFTMVMFVDMCDGEFRVEDWKMLKHQSQRPVYNHRLRQWESLWFDGLKLRKVVSPTFRETWTQHDYEVMNRKVHPLINRRVLPR